MTNVQGNPKDQAPKGERLTEGGEAGRAFWASHLILFGSLSVFELTGERGKGVRKRAQENSVAVTEADTCRKYVVPELLARGGSLLPNTGKCRSTEKRFR